jgi:hypothetical protein
MLAKIFGFQHNQRIVPANNDNSIKDFIISNPHNNLFMKPFQFLIFCTLLIGCQNSPPDLEYEQKQINQMLDSWNKAAAKGDFDYYFKCFAEDGIFIGTDATEHWNKKDFMVWAKPYFDRGKAWDFKSMERHIYFDQSGSLAWFDELLNTQMKICRGSGVLIKEGDKWKIKQYVLSMTIPNAKTDSVVKIKSLIEEDLIKSLQK